MQRRREVLLGLALALGGPAALSACDNVSNDALLNSLKPDGALRFYKRREYLLLGVLADAIIPRTDTPGAADVGVPAYLDAMMDTWASDATKSEHRAALKAIRDALGANILSLPDEERRAAVASLDARVYGGGEDTDNLFGRYRAVKSLIASVYYASEPGATQELHYEMVPGRWDGDAPLSEIGKTWYE